MSANNGSGAGQAPVVTPLGRPAPLPPPRQQRKNKSSGETLKLLINEFNDYGHRTTVHGLGHMYQSTDIRRKFFWLCITFIGCIACGVHVYFIVANYQETPVNSVILNGAANVTFPDVTLCNMYPISESVLYHGSKDFRDHMQKYWQFFRGFINSSSTQGDTARDRFKMARQFFQIFWVSEDTRDLGHDDDLFLVYCRYRSRICSKKQFKLIQNNDYWNCYTFAPEFGDQPDGDRRVYSSNEDDGLNLILYTNTHLRNLHPDSGLTTVKGSFNHKGESHLGPRSDQSNFLERYIVNYNLSLNQLLAGDKLEPDGIRVILHEKGTYPHMDLNSVIVGNGDYSNIVFEMERKKSRNRPEHPCREIPEESGDEEIEYVLYYPGKDERLSGKSPNFKKFKRHRLDYVAERTQDLFWSICGCYTHMEPFQHFNSRLCYFCRNGTDPAEIQRTVQRVSCHDQVYDNQLKKNLLGYFSDSQRFQPCTVDQYNVKMGSSAWPSQRDIHFLLNQYVIPAFLNESIGSRNYSRILRKTKVFPIRDIIGMSEVTDAATGAASLNWSVQEFLVRKSFLKIAIHADSPTGPLNEEVESYSFAEALSEIGGIFGLYAGVSLLTFFEFVELAYLMATKPKEVKNKQMEGVSKFAMLQQAMEEGEVPQDDLLRYKQLFDHGKCCSRASVDVSHRCKNLIMETEREDSDRRPVIVA